MIGSCFTWLVVLIVATETSKPQSAEVHSQERSKPSLRLHFSNQRVGILWSINHLELQLISLAWSSKKWWMRILSDLHVLIYELVSKFHVFSFLFDRHIVNTILGPGNKMTYSLQIAIFPHFVIHLNALYCLFFQPVQASFTCLPAVLRFVESVITLPKPFKKRNYTTSGIQF